MPVIEAMLRKLLNDALRGDEKALKLLLSLIERHGEPSEATTPLGEILAEDKAILARYPHKPADGASKPSSQANHQGSDDAGAGGDI